MNSKGEIINKEEFPKNVSTTHCFLLIYVCVPLAVKGVCAYWPLRERVCAFGL
jgi:hypothetical protein